MAYASDYNYLTLHWQISGTLPETAQCGLKFIGPNLPDQAMVDGAAAAVTTFWSSSSSMIPPVHALTFLRLARIGVDGKYLPGAVSYDHVFSPVIPGGATITAEPKPAQTSHVVTLRTAQPRGIAHAGRIYLPPIHQAIQVDYTWAIATVNNRLNTLSAMLSTLSGSNLGDLAVMSKGTPTHPAGQSNTVTYINADTLPDVQRRRAKQLISVRSASYNVL